MKRVEERTRFSAMSTLPQGQYISFASSLLPELFLFFHIDSYFYRVLLAKLAVELIEVDQAERATWKTDINGRKLVMHSGWLTICMLRYVPWPVKRTMAARCSSPAVADLPTRGRSSYASHNMPVKGKQRQRVREIFPRQIIRA